MSYLIDTNVISETRKRNGSIHVLAFMKILPIDGIYLSVFTMGEIRNGINKLAPGKKTELLAWYDSQLQRAFEGRIIPVDCAIIERWSDLVSRHPRTLPFIDSILAATCLERDLTLLTRNVRDFDDIPGIKLLNPWTAATPPGPPSP